MKQFTSHIGFSLTRKRFKMMIKHYSPIRSYSIKLILLPVLLVITIMFCTRQPDYPINVTENNDALYSTVDLYMNPPKSEKLNIERRGFGIRYNSEGDPFTGIQEMRFVKNDSIFRETVYENGLTKSTEVYIRDGDSVNNYRYEYGYIREHFKAVKHYKNGVLLEEWGDAKPDELGYHKQWHPNGQLKYEAYFEGNIEYEGLMTLYDEDGNIIKQEHYENGELISSGKGEMINTQPNFAAPSDTLSNEERTKLDEAAKIYQQKYQAYMDLDPETIGLENLRTAFRNVDEAVHQLNQVMREIYGEDVVLPPVNLGPKPEERKKNN